MFELSQTRIGYPDPDSSIKSALDVAANGDDYSKMRLGCLIFLTIVFEEVKTELVSNNCTCNSPEDWRKYLEHKISAESKGTLRNDLYRRILNATYVSGLLTCQFISQLLMALVSETHPS